MSPYKAVHGGGYPLIDNDRLYPSAVRAFDNYYHRHQEIKNVAYKALKLARASCMRVTTKGMTEFKHVEIGGLIMLFGDQFATESSSTRMVQPR